MIIFYGKLDRITGGACTSAIFSLSNESRKIPLRFAFCSILFVAFAEFVSSLDVCSALVIVDNEVTNDFGAIVGKIAKFD